MPTVRPRDIVAEIDTLFPFGTTQALDRDLPVILYLQEGIAMEGVRQQLMLNPVHFKDNAEVLSHFKERLANGLFQPTANAVSF